LVLNAGGGIGLAVELLNNLEVYPEKMEENLKKTKGYIMAESVMMQLAKKLGKQKSHDLIHDLIDRAQKENKSFREIIEQDELVSHYSKNEIDSWLNPQNYLGQTQPMIDAVIKKAEPFVKEK
jgi:adenylosuccinate lyase